MDEEYLVVPVNLYVTTRLNNTYVRHHVISLLYRKPIYSQQSPQYILLANGHLTSMYGYFDLGTNSQVEPIRGISYE